MWNKEQKNVCLLIENVQATMATSTLFVLLLKLSTHPVFHYIR